MGLLKGNMKLFVATFAVALCSLVSLPAWSQKSRSELFAKSYEYESNKQFDLSAVNLRLGWLYYNKGSFKASLLYYSKAIQQRPTSLEARFGYVLPAAKMKDWLKVGKQYDAILKLDPNNTKANYYRGLMYFNVGEYSKAEPYFDVRLRHSHSLRLERLLPEE